MQELSYWPIAQRQAVTGLFTDIDDTLTTEGEITPDALEALKELKAAGMKKIATITRCSAIEAESTHSIVRQRDCPSTAISQSRSLGASISEENAKATIMRNP